MSENVVDDERAAGRAGSLGGRARGRRPPPGRARVAAIALAAFAVAGQSLAADAPAWPVIGRQGIVRLVLVPASQAADRSAYEHQIEQLCSAGETCFLNFYTNIDGGPVTVPLSDAIAEQATATFRRSVKQGAEMFMWSCRMKVSADKCF